MSALHTTEPSTRLRKPGEIKFYFKSFRDLCAGGSWKSAIFMKSGLLHVTAAGVAVRDPELIVGVL